MPRRKSYALSANREFVVDKGIPLPSSRISGVSEILDRLEIGDSFLIRTRSQYVGSYQWARRRKAKVAIRKVEDGKWRVWRRA